MNGLVVLAACVCASSAQLLARAVHPAHQSHQFHAQDEFGQFSFGHAGGPSARTESRDAYGVTRGSYQYLDSFGLIQTVNYVSDAAGFRVAGSNLPVGPAGPIADTAEVAAAKAEFQAAFDAAAAAAAPEEPAAEAEVAVEAEERKKREADNVVLNAAFPYAAHAAFPYAAHAAFPYALPAAGLPAAGLPAAGLLPYPYTAGLLAAAPADIVANVELPAAAVDAAAVDAAPAVFPYAGLPVAAPAVAGREATLTEVKLNPGHAVFYRVD